MDPIPNNSALFGPRGSAGSSTRGFSIHVDDNEESVSEAGDIGDRALSLTETESGGIISADNSTKGTVFPLGERDQLQTCGFVSSTNTDSDIHPTSVFREDMLCSESKESILAPNQSNQGCDTVLRSKFLIYTSCLLHLAVFGIIGVLTRYALQKLFGPGVAGVTSDHQLLYLDLPSNMIGSFLMGWWGVVFKSDISSISENLAIGLTTGYLGSLTTFSGWNQKMLDLVIDGRWVLSFMGYLLGLFLAAYSIRFGIGTAYCFKLFIALVKTERLTNFLRLCCHTRHNSVAVLLTLVLVLLLTAGTLLLKTDLSNNHGAAKLWLACIVAAPGVWIRWFLARLNGRGLGKKKALKWIPWGTLIANVSAACLMALLSTVKKLVHNRICSTIATGLQFGFLGCLGTVSTFIAEYSAMEDSNKNWRAYMYALITMLPSFGLGVLLYCVPLWATDSI